MKELSKTVLNQSDYQMVTTIDWTSLNGCWTQQLIDLVRLEAFTADIQSIENMLIQILLNLRKISKGDESFKDEFMEWALPVQINEKDIEWEKLKIALFEFSLENKDKNIKNEENNEKNVINVPLDSHKVTRTREFIQSLNKQHLSYAKTNESTKIHIRRNRFKEMMDLWPLPTKKTTTIAEMLKFNFKAQKWRLKRETLFYLQKSKIVKEIFDYNNLLINFSMTSSKNKLINKLFNSIKLKLNNIMMTSSWTTKKNYAALIRDKNIDPEVYLDYNQLNLNMTVWIKNWEIEKIKEFCTKQKEKQWDLISYENNDKIYEILEHKQWKGQAKEWCKFYGKKKEERMDQEENLNKIET
jgi:hypothetical protein